MQGGECIKKYVKCNEEYRKRLWTVNVVLNTVPVQNNVNVHFITSFYMIGK